MTAIYFIIAIFWESNATWGTWLLSVLIDGNSAIFFHWFFLFIQWIKTTPLAGSGLFNLFLASPLYANLMPFARTMVRASMPDPLLVSSSQSETLYLYAPASVWRWFQGGIKQIILQVQFPFLAWRELTIPSRTHRTKTEWILLP